MGIFFSIFLVLLSIPALAAVPRDQIVAQQLDAVEASHAPTYRGMEELPFEVKQKLDPRHTHSLETGTDIYYSSYAEPDAGVKNRGVMTGYHANYAYRPEDGNFLNNVILNMYGFEARFAYGKLDYKGSGKDKNSNYNYELRALAGKDYLLADRSLWTPYLGFGYRYLLDKGNGLLTSTGSYGYDRHSNYFYLPVGFNASIPYGSWTSALNIEYDIFLHGVQVSDFSDGDQFNQDDNPNIHNSQGSGYGLRGSLKLTYAMQKFNIYIEPFFRFWSIKRSNLVSATVDGVFSDQWNEPSNTTWEIGSKFGLQF